MLLVMPFLESGLSSSYYFGQRVSEICTLTSEPRTLSSLRTKFNCLLPKVVLQFHNNQAIFLQVFYLKSHANKEEQHFQSLDIRWALVFYRKDHAIA